MTTTDPTAFDLNSDARFSTDPLVRHINAFTAHGGHHVYMPFITPVADNLYHGGVEQGLILPEGIKHIVSLYKWQSYDSLHELDSVVVTTMLDSVEQGFEQVDLLAEWVNLSRKTGPVLVHCQAGLNRSSLVVARALMLSGEVETGQEAIDLLRAKRSPGVLCNPAFEEWVRNSG